VVPQPSNIVLLAQTEEGYRNLMRLVSHAYFGVPYEIGIIRNMKFPGYFLIVSDFIKWAKDHNIPR
jgi:DNA polymerase III alpha subunit